MNCDRALYWDKVEEARAHLKASAAKAFEAVERLVVLMTQEGLLTPAK